MIGETAKPGLHAASCPKQENRYSASGFLDIHCHILPGLDEGPRTAEQSLRMIELARRDGTTGIVATPHIIRGIYNNTKDIIARAISELNEAASRIGLYMGAEIRIDRDIAARVNTGELPLINDKNFILLELPTYVIPPLGELEKVIKDLRDRRIYPIFAHPERNMTLMKDLSIVKRLVRCGALFQMTATSIDRCDIQRAALKMIKKGYIHVVASDAHDDLRRPPILSEAYEMVSRKIDRDLANELFMINPLNIVQGRNVG